MIKPKHTKDQEVGNFKALLLIVIISGLVPSTRRVYNILHNQEYSRGITLFN